MARIRQLRGHLGRLVRSAARARSAIARSLLDTLAPPRCVACQQLLPDIAGAAPRTVWCDDCAAGVVPLGDRFCLHCRSTHFAPRHDCEAALSLLAAVQYGDAVAALVRATKYEGWEPLLDVWLAIWCTLVREGEGPIGEGPELLCPVPTHPSRRRERGFALPELWAGRLAARTGRARVAALVRARPTRPQVGLDRRARQANVAGAFAPGPEAGAVAGRRIALVDDVVTSGATVRESANLLRSLDARQIEVWSFAYEPIE